MAHHSTADWQPSGGQDASYLRLESIRLTPDSYRRSADLSTWQASSVCPETPRRALTPDVNSESNFTPEERHNEQSVPTALKRDTSNHDSNYEATKGEKPIPSIFVAWRDEILMLLLATGLLVAIILILNSFRHQKRPDWGRQVNLNALIAVLSTILRASIAYIALEIIGHVKWDWISIRPRSMRDVQSFDDASRGVYGSLKLLHLNIFRVPLALGAVGVTIVSLGIGPFTQQAIQTYQCHQLATPNATNEGFIAAAMRFKNNNALNQFGPGNFKFNQSWQLAMHDSIINPSLETNIVDLFDCPSGDCTFPTYENSEAAPKDEAISYSSLAMCNRCADVYDLVEAPTKSKSNSSGGEVFRVRLPVPTGSANASYDSFLEFGSNLERYMTIEEVKNLTWAGDKISTDMLNRERYAIAKFAIIARSDANCKKLENGTLSCPHGLGPRDQQTDYVAAACIIYPCMKYYTGRVLSGRLSEKVIRDKPLRPQASAKLDHPDDIISEVRLVPWSGVQQPCMVNGTLYTSQNMSKAEELDGSTTTQVMAIDDDFDRKDPKAQENYTNITAPTECVATFDEDFTYRFRQALRRQLYVACSFHNRSEVVQCQDSLAEPDTGGNNVWYMVGLLRNRTTTFDNLQESIDSITMRMTRGFRRNGLGANGQGMGTVPAQVWESNICIDVAWGWIALPAGLCVVCILLLAATLVKNAAQKQKPIWKNSVLPLLLNDYPDIGSMSISQVQEVSDGYIIKLRNSQNAEPLDIRAKEGFTESDLVTK